jgi:hypothetical protein
MSDNASMKFQTDAAVSTAERFKVFGALQHYIFPDAVLVSQHQQAKPVIARQRRDLA